MKKTGRFEIRVEPDEWIAFRKACDDSKVKAAHVISDLCRAAIPYMQKHCTDGRWRPPSLMSDKQVGAIEAAAVVQVHNGNGHQVARAAEGKLEWHVQPASKKTRKQ